LRAASLGFMWGILAGYGVWLHKHASMEDGVGESPPSGAQVLVKQHCSDLGPF